MLNISKRNPEGGLLSNVPYYTHLIASFSMGSFLTGLMGYEMIKSIKDIEKMSFNGNLYGLLKDLPLMIGVTSLTYEAYYSIVRPKGKLLLEETIIPLYNFLVQKGYIGEINSEL